MAYRVGYVFDDRMALHRPRDQLNANTPEKPERITSTHSTLTARGLLDKPTRIQARYATEDELLLAHSADHIAEVKGYRSLDKLTAFSLEETHPTYVCDDTFSSASLAAGSFIGLVDGVCRGEIDCGFALIRPPGHHADTSESNGFCFFNNIAIATRAALARYPDIARVAIVDWDVHHGNGLQRSFYDDDRVLYISMHRYDNGTFYPGLEEGNAYAAGLGKGAGFNVNIPWNDAKMGDAEYKAAYEQVVRPILEQFSPDLVLVACGFDAVRGDPLGQYDVTPQMFGWMTSQLKRFARGRLALALEGGYNIPAIGDCASCVMEALLKPKFELEIPAGEIHESARDTLKVVKMTQAIYWKF